MRNPVSVAADPSNHVSGIPGSTYDSMNTVVLTQAVTMECYIYAQRLISSKQSPSLPRCVIVSSLQLTSLQLSHAQLGRRKGPLELGHTSSD